MSDATPFSPDPERVVLGASVSWLPNNLSALCEKESNEIEFAFVHRSSVHTTLYRGEGQQALSKVVRSPRNDKAADTGADVLQAVWCRLRDRVLLAVLTVRGVEVGGRDATCLARFLG